MSTKLPHSTTVRTYRGRSLAELIPRIREELGPDAIILREREGLTGGLNGFFAQRCVEVDAQAAPSIDFYDDDADALPEPETPAAVAAVEIDADAEPGMQPEADTEPGMQPEADTEAQTAEHTFQPMSSLVPETVAEAVANAVANTVAPSAPEAPAQPEVAAQPAAAEAESRPGPAESAPDLIGSTRLAAEALSFAQRLAQAQREREHEPETPMAAPSDPVGDLLEEARRSGALSQLLANLIRREAEGAMAAPEPAPMPEAVAEPMPAETPAWPRSAYQSDAPAAPMPPAAPFGSAAPYASAAASYMTPPAPAAPVAPPAPVAQVAPPPQPMQAPAYAMPEPPQAYAAPAPAPVAHAHAHVDPALAGAISRELVGRGISEAWAHELIMSAAAHGTPFATEGSLRDAVRTTLASAISSPPPLPSSGAAIAFVGAGGAGKTRCAAAMAAVYNRSSMLGVSLVSLGTGAAQAIARGREHGMVVIDTPGTSPVDSAGVAALANHLASLGLDAVYLAVPATLSGSAARHLVDGLAPVRATALVITHADETDELGIATEIAYLTGLPIAFIHGGLDLERSLSPVDPARLAARLLP